MEFSFINWLYLVSQHINDCFDEFHWKSCSDLELKFFDQWINIIMPKNLPTDSQQDIL